MNKFPLVSIIIPVYNGEKTLRECLSSVLNQNYPNLEIIVVNNNSTDNTEKIIKEFQEKDKRIKFIFESKIGRGAARNAGINVANGEIIAMIDADCIAPENWIKELIKPILYEKEQIVMGSEMSNSENYWAKNIQKSDLKFYQTHASDGYINLLDTKNFAIKSNLIKKIMFDNNLPAGVDLDFYLRLKKDSKLKIRFLPEIKVLHYHVTTLKAYFKKQMERGYWTYKIYKKYENNDSIKKEKVLKSAQIKNFILIPFCSIFKLFKRPLKEIPFLFISEIAWRIGIMKAIFKFKC